MWKFKLNSTSDYKKKEKQIPQAADGSVASQLQPSGLAPWGCRKPHLSGQFSQVAPNNNH